MGADITSLLPYLPGLPFAAAVIVLYRLWSAAVRDLRDERTDHRATQEELDREREARRKMEDKVDVLTREVRGLTAEVARLRTQIGDGT